MSNERSDDEEEVEVVLARKIIIIIIIIIIMQLVIQRADEVEENLFQKQIEDEIEGTLKTTLNPKVLRVVKNLQASHNDDANIIMELAAQQKATTENLDFSLIQLFQ